MMGGLLKGIMSQGGSGIRLKQRWVRFLKVDD